MNELDSLKRRVEQLETALETAIPAMVRVSQKQAGEDEKSSAAFEALFDLVRELASHEGISQQAFQKHYEIRFRYWLDRNLKRVEDQAPNLAGEIDTRSTGDFDFPDTFPPLFGPPPA